MSDWPSGDHASPRARCPSSVTARALPVGTAPDVREMTYVVQTGARLHQSYARAEPFGATAGYAYPPSGSELDMRRRVFSPPVERSTMWLVPVSPSTSTVTMPVPSGNQES